MYLKVLDTFCLDLFGILLPLDAEQQHFLYSFEETTVFFGVLSRETLHVIRPYSLWIRPCMIMTIYCLVASG